MNSALAAASAALAADSERHDSRSRVCFLLAEMGSRPEMSGESDGPLRVTRSELARAAAIPLTRAKRILALLDLSGVVEQDGAGIRVTDWQRLCSMAAYDRSRRGLPDDEQDSADGEGPAPAPRPINVTRAGDPASFV